jgi:hypothetical protein
MHTTFNLFLLQQPFASNHQQSIPLQQAKKPIVNHVTQTFLVGRRKRDDHGRSVSDCHFRSDQERLGPGSVTGMSTQLWSSVVLVKWVLGKKKNIVNCWILEMKNERMQHRVS